MPPAKVVTWAGSRFVKVRAPVKVIRPLKVRAPDPKTFMAWMGSDEGRGFVTASSEAWYAANDLSNVHP